MNNENKKTNGLSDRYNALLNEIEDKIAQHRNLNSEITDKIAQHRNLESEIKQLVNIKNEMEAMEEETRLPKTWEEFCDKCEVTEGLFINNDSYVRFIKKYMRDSERDKNLLPTRQAAEAHLALMQLHQLRDCYRQGWVPGLGDGNDKYVVQRCTAGLYVVAVDAVSVFLSFQSEEIAEQFLDNFRDLIEQAGDLI